LAPTRKNLHQVVTIKPATHIKQKKSVSKSRRSKKTVVGTEFENEETPKKMSQEQVHALKKQKIAEIK
jgi:hypothetical protein